MAYVYIVAFAFFLLGCRLYLILPRRGKRIHSSRSSVRDQTCSVAVFLGSGGHTSEALAMFSGLDFRRYQPRKYIVSDGDNLSAQKAVILEEAIAIKYDSQAEARAGKPYQILTIPRARRVHQPLMTSSASACFSLLSCVYYVTIEPFLSSRGRTTCFADVLILNGPGTCLMLCMAVYINKFFGLHSPVIIYVESFARVKHLSLSGKLLRPLVDKFVVQWPQLLRDKGRGECYGWLV